MGNIEQAKQLVYDAINIDYGKINQALALLDTEPETTAYNPSEAIRLKKDNKELRKLMRIMLRDINYGGLCFTCTNFKRNGGECYGANQCRDTLSRGIIPQHEYEYRHADRAREVGVEV